MPQFTTLLYVGSILLFGLLFGRFVKIFKFPNVTGYLLSGLILGPHILSFYSLEVIQDCSIVSEMALAFIAFIIGCEFKRSFLKKLGITPVVIAFFEALLAVVIVDTILIVTGHNVAFSIVLGSIAAATAPAATVMIIKQYRAKGPVTDMLMSVVALDDSVALIAFAISVSVAKSLNGNGDLSVVQAILTPMVEIFFTLIMGTIFGISIYILMKFFKKQNNQLIITVSVIFICSSLSSFFGLSSLLSCMMCGMLFCNISSESDEIVSLLGTCTPPIYVMFFVVSGAQLNIELIPQIGSIGLIYVIGRVIGKLLGARIGAEIMRANKAICRYVGPALIPQAGVAIGLIVVAETVVPEYSDQIRTIILCATMLYEIVGPVIAKSALKKAGEIQET
ncbi:cation:proton antiporter [Anaerovorax sp. IOR16]|uniref:cation:proton antiporter n=1 Tax=Anaerovorax sp. IOR16 TaxID=2773458 RepID=UPI0019D2EA1B|nr:cation:proton antiporter [Anaerovorax sp. IOR16]